MILRRIAAILLIAAAQVAASPAGNLEPQLRLCLRSDPKTFDPLLVDEEAGETIRYLTGGVLIRLNRSTQKLESELAESWNLSSDGRRITFTLRSGVRFSDGTPFSSADVVATLRRLMDPALKSPMGDSFRASTSIPVIKSDRPNQVTIEFPVAVAGVERLFDSVAISSTASPAKERAALGPFAVHEYVSGSYIALARNRYYWRRDEKDRTLPYLGSVRFDIQSNRDMELLRFRRGELHVISGLDPVAFEQLRSQRLGFAMHSAPSNDNEMIWFNQVPGAPIPAHKKAWFASQVFRRALSGAINRADIARLVYRGHAQPAAGPFSEQNRLWFNPKIKPHAYAPDQSLKQLHAAGFRTSGGKLIDRHGNPVEFSMVTNAGNKSRARIAALVQQDLAKLGVRLNITTLDFPALVERISRTFAYEACLLGLVNVDPDPNGQMNVWLSSAANHQWNPRQATPATPWEAEIDRLMREQAASQNVEKRRASFARVQEIISEQVPFVYLVTKNALAAADPRVRNLAPSPLIPQLLWNAHRLTLAPSPAGSR